METGHIPKAHLFFCFFPPIAARPHFSTSEFPRGHRAVGGERDPRSAILGVRAGGREPLSSPAEADGGCEPATRG